MFGIVEFTFSLAMVILLITSVNISREKKKKKEIKRKFREFTDSYRLSKKELRTVPRIAIPDSMEVILALTDKDYFGLKAHAIDMSLSGFAVRPDFPLKKLPLDTCLENVLVITPINTFIVQMVKIIRLEHHVDKRLLAFHIERIDGDQFEIHKTFMAYLDTFLKKNDEYGTS